MAGVDDDQSVEDTESYNETHEDSAEKKTVNKSYSNKRTNIILVGLPGCGKSSTGWLLAKQMGLGFFDTDEWIVSLSRKPIVEIFKNEGESGFRKYEEQVVKFISNIQNHVISIGGGLLESDENWKILESRGRLVYLNCSLAELSRRLTVDPQLSGLKSRPLLADLADVTDKEIREQRLTERLAILLSRRKERFLASECIVGSDYSTAECDAFKVQACLQKLQNF
ncbi:MAG: shikimate kinase [Bdellovibrionota bacterium]